MCFGSPAALSGVESVRLNVESVSERLPIILRFRSRAAEGWMTPAGLNTGDVGLSAVGATGG